MAGHSLVCLFLASTMFLKWSPEQLIALIRVVEIPGLCAIAIVWWRTKMSRLLDAIIDLINRLTKFEGLGLKIETLPAEEVRALRDDDTSDRIVPLSRDRLLHIVPNVTERYRRLIPVKQSPNLPKNEEGHDKPNP